MRTPTSAIVPVWLTLDDLQVIELCLNDLLSSHELKPESEQNIVRLARLFDQVRAESLAHQS
jgi:hypothetical protein